MKIYNYNDFPINLTKVALTHKESFKKSPSTILSTKQLTKFYENQLKSNNRFNLDQLQGRLHSFSRTGAHFKKSHELTLFLPKRKQGGRHKKDNFENFQ